MKNSLGPSSKSSKGMGLLDNSLSSAAPRVNFSPMTTQQINVAKSSKEISLHSPGRARKFAGKGCTVQTYASASAIH